MPMPHLGGGGGGGGGLDIDFVGVHFCRVVF